MRSELKKIVGLDVDEVLADFLTPFFKESRRLFGKPKKGFEPQFFDLQKCGWTEREMRQVLARLKGIPNFWRTLDSLPKTRGLRKAYARHNILFITSRFATDGAPVATQTSEWLRDNYVIPDAYVEVTTDKAKAACEMSLDAFLDDKIENCQQVKKARKACDVYILTRSWNEKWDAAKHGVERVETVDEFFREIE